jgi:hypothetical protein
MESAAGIADDWNAVQRRDHIWSIDLRQSSDGLRDPDHPAPIYF